MAKVIVFLAPLIALAAICWLIFWLGGRAGQAKAAYAARRSQLDPKLHADMFKLLSEILTPNSSIDPDQVKVLPDDLRRRGEELLVRFSTRTKG